MIRQGLGFAISVLMLFAMGCAKQPATTMSSAPAPTGDATTTPGGTTTAGARSSDGAPPVSQSASATRATARPAPGDFVPAPELEDVHFDFDRYEIRPGDARVLDANAAWLKTNGDRLLLIEGHCDERGTNEYNVALGERRAKATMNYLVAHGVAATRITIVSYGEERPACSEHSEACWAKNRRAHFLVKRG